jgi:hypothetical protein
MQTSGRRLRCAKGLQTGGRAVLKMSAAGGVGHTLAFRGGFSFIPDFSPGFSRLAPPPRPAPEGPPLRGAFCAYTCGARPIEEQSR